MKFKIHNGYEDYVIIEGKTMNEIRGKADIETEKRGWKQKDLWSEEMEEGMGNYENR